MGHGQAERIESAVDGGAAALFAGAVAFAAARLGSIPLTVAAAAAAFAGCLLTLAQVRPRVPSFALAEFACAPFEPVVPDELVLTDADRRTPLDNAPSDAVLVLDDILAELGPDSRVVRLFDPAAMPTAGELKARIDGHLNRAIPAAPDATQDLYAALDELRRSLR
ncbi:MAG TPA: hypothetical protein VFP57_00890 [Sphingomicrobium sp.]|jgi:hypothetical protein|nr:hypothetical protein [Sphingomicrobium sp.]